MDEATSSVDTLTENLIQQDGSYDERTDQFYYRSPAFHNKTRRPYPVIEDGKIIEEGTHFQLLAKRKILPFIYATVSRRKRTGSETESVIRISSFKDSI